MLGSLKEYLRGPDGAYSRLWIGLVLSLLIGLIPVTMFFVNYSPEAWRVKDDLEREFQLIQPFPQAVSKAHVFKAEPRLVYVLNSYETAASDAEILSYYDSELPKQGWKKCGEERRQESWFGTRGDTSSVYCKKSYKIFVVHDEEEKGGARSFTLRFQWKN
jgi:hypothetical protein